MRILITGITGFAGSHLAEYVLAEHPEVEVYGTMRWRSRTENIRSIEGNITLLECDLRDQSSVKILMERVRPDRIFHLAAQSFVPSSWNAPAESLQTNIIGQLHVFEAVRSVRIDPWIQIACSSEEYGLVQEDELPIRETNPLRPLSPYAVSKVGQDYLGYQYFKSFGTKVVRTRGFNHDGPRRGDVFVSSNFAKQIAAIEKGRKPPVIHVGNLDAQRDFTDVRDMVRGYWLSVDGRCEPGEAYNICSGAGFSIRTVLDMLLQMSGASVEVQEDPERLRPSDVPVLVGDCTKFREATGWVPRIPYEQTLADMLDYWRAEID
ncbi:MAG TPA: GDP-mannose 4,6-dehydratase [Vicinamibacteria bacterium]|nr:GDP-mannose 4,6-dehydratase [Vicinamibacteria bacterium]